MRQSACKLGHVSLLVTGLFFFAPIFSFAAELVSPRRAMAAPMSFWWMVNLHLVTKSNLSMLRSIAKMQLLFFKAPGATCLRALRLERLYA